MKRFLVMCLVIFGTSSLYGSQTPSKDEAVGKEETPLREIPDRPVGVSFYMTPKTSDTPGERVVIGDNPADVLPQTGTERDLHQSPTREREDGQSPRDRSQREEQKQGESQSDENRQDRDTLGDKTQPDEDAKQKNPEDKQKDEAKKPYSLKKPIIITTSILGIVCLLHRPTREQAKETAIAIKDSSVNLCKKIRESRRAQLALGASLAVGGLALWYYTR